MELPPTVYEERRLTRRAVIFWRSLRRVHGLPAMQDFHPERMPVPWESCFMLEIDALAAEPLVDYVGSEVDVGGGLAGRSVSDLPAGTLIGHAAGPWRTCLDARLPVLVAGGFRDTAGAVVLHRSVLMPFGHGNTDIDYLIGATSHRVLSEPATDGARGASPARDLEPESVEVVGDDA